MHRRIQTCTPKRWQDIWDYNRLVEYPNACTYVYRAGASLCAVAITWSSKLILVVVAFGPCALRVNLPAHVCSHADPSRALSVSLCRSLTRSIFLQPPPPHTITTPTRLPPTRRSIYPEKHKDNGVRTSASATPSANRSARTARKRLLHARSWARHRCLSRVSAPARSALSHSQIPSQIVCNRQSYR